MLKPIVAAILIFSTISAAATINDPIQNGITFPVNEVKTLPAGSTTDLSKGQVYVIAHTKQLLIRQRTTNQGTVTVTQKAGPITFPVESVPGYSDPSGYVTFTQPYIYLLKAGNPGDLEIEVIPAINATTIDPTTKTLKQLPLTELDIQKKFIRVLGDLPPPPTPKPAPKATNLSIIVIEDLNARKPEHTLILADADFWQTVTTQGHNWALYSKNAQELKGTTDLTTANTIGLPTLIIKDKATDKILVQQKLPATKADFNNIIKSLVN